MDDSRNGPLNAFPSLPAVGWGALKREVPTVTLSGKGACISSGVKVLESKLDA